MNRYAQMPRCPVAGVLPSPGDRSERVAQLDGDLLGRDADVEFELPRSAAPLPSRPEQPRVQVADDVITQEVVERQGAVECRRHQLVDHLVLHALFEVVDVRG